MRHLWLFLLLALAPVVLAAYGRSGNLADPVFLNTGTESMGLTVTLSTSSASLTYDASTSGYTDREVMLQNTSSDYTVYCGTFSTVAATYGNRWMLPPFPVSFTTNTAEDIYCIVDNDAGSTTVEVLGRVEFDPKD